MSVALLSGRPADLRPAALHVSAPPGSPRQLLVPHGVPAPEDPVELFLRGERRPGGHDPEDSGQAGPLRGREERRGQGHLGDHVRRHGHQSTGTVVISPLHRGVPSRVSARMSGDT